MPQDQQDQTPQPRELRDEALKQLGVALIHRSQQVERGEPTDEDRDYAYILAEECAHLAGTARDLTEIAAVMRTEAPPADGETVTVSVDQLVELARAATQGAVQRLSTDRALVADMDRDASPADVAGDIAADFVRNLHREGSI